MSSSITVDRVDFPIADVVLQQPDWSGLPMDILELIFWRLRYAADLIRIRAVCRKWCSVVNTVRHKPLCPLLLLDSESNSGVYDLFDFSKNKILRTRLYATDQVPTDLFIDRRFTNSCNGWLARMDYSSGSWAIHLINPFTRVQIQLPPTATFEEDPPTGLDRIYVGAKSRFLRKAVLSSAPLDPKCVVMAIYCIDALDSGDEELKLALCSPPRDTSTWKTLKSDQPKDFFVDIIYFMDQFYALGRSQELFRCDIINSSDDEPKVVPISLLEPLPELEALLGPEEPFMELRALLREQETMEGPELEWTQLGPRGRKSRSYLVDWCGDLLMVVRYAVYNKVYICKTARFKVFKFDFGRGRWDVIDSLGDGSIFVSYSATALLSVKEDFPEFKPNCIYFTDDNHAKGWLNMRDAGVFCLSTEVCKPWRVMAGIWPPPFLWISPDLRTSEFILSNLN